MRGRSKECLVGGRTSRSGRGKSCWGRWLAAYPLVPLIVDIHKRMRKPHLGTVYDTIPNTFHKGEDVMVFGIEDDLLGRRLVV